MRECYEYCEVHDCKECPCYYDNDPDMIEHLNGVESLYSYTELSMIHIFRGTWCDTPKVWTKKIPRFFEIEYIYRNDLEIPYHEEG